MIKFGLFKIFGPGSPEIDVVTVGFPTILTPKKYKEWSIWQPCN
jgi:hypothetical protein